MDPFTAAWVLWIAAFIVIEGRALKRGQPGDTLSEHVWTWFGVKRGWAWKRAALAAFMAWLSVHFVFGWMTL
ncbi:hypothetical protein E1298_01905 [Actinomadura rubrisoli]|uniref:Uncharacterized protein n=1 Tax=Actinomadura rubrisoli TaxID=2530368 RepID=A0A4R5CBB4_9ACTN|nr:hypothetical protein E1298_01905 [Actinomadura rubrisoli]